MSANPVVEVLLSFVGLFWMFLPAYLPNSAATLFGGGKKIDGGATLWDGMRLFGDGKTWRGFFGGWAFGFFIGLIQILLSHPFDPTNHWGFGDFPQAIAIVFVISFASLFGDLTASFFKRRFGLLRGEPVPLLDQYDFFVMAIIFEAIFFWPWFWKNYLDGLVIYGFALLIIVTYFIHRGVNILGYKMGYKKEPW